MHTSALARLHNQTESWTDKGENKGISIPLQCVCQNSELCSAPEEVFLHELIFIASGFGRGSFKKKKNTDLSVNRQTLVIYIFFPPAPNC